jgi:hypothetical protein
MDVRRRGPLGALLVSAVLLATAAFSLPAPTQAATARSGGFFSGRLVDPATGNPVRGATVKVFEINTDHLLGRDVSGARGYFRIDGLSAADEELDVRVNGAAVDHETGWVGCHHNVVPSWGAACSFPQGHQTPFRVEHL